ncbi:outer membrane beta-barrel protein [Fluviicola sp.]|uniref:outer membrane beta-barrel protein n=1 Tax=Fluviicola sp. TaxID=1917219 RepID=UPI0031CDBA2B
MKKLILPVLAVFSLGTASAQFNLGVSVGYGLGSPGHVLGTNTTSTSSSYSEKNIYGTLGSGLQANLTPGYMFGEHFGVELGLNGFFGSKTTIGEATFPGGSYKHTQSSSQFRVSPALVVKSGGEKLSVYARGGLVLPLLGSVKSEINDNGASTPGVNTMAELKTSGKVSLGYTGAVGLNVHFGQKMAFFAELGANSLRVKSKQTDLTKYTVNGTDQLGNVSTYGKQTKYVDELTNSSNNASVNPSGTNTANAKEDLRQVANFSNFFIQVGIKFSFGK